MNPKGERIHRTRLIQSGNLVVAVDIKMVIPVDDPSEPCLEAETIKFLKQVHEHAERGDVEWLKRHGKVYALIDAA
jgi:hypothetical protein